MKERSTATSSDSAVVAVNVERGYACSIEVITGDRASTRTRMSELRRRVFVAYYSPAAMANGWEPFDQPSPAAYMPFAFADFLREPVDGAGSVLVQRMPDEIVATPTPSAKRRDRVLAKALRAAFSKAGAPQVAAERALALLERVSRVQATAA